MNKLATGKITALYSRLSREDMLTGDSLSIKNQRDILENYAAQHGFTHTRHFFDDGTSGVHFDRDGFKQLIEEVKAGRIGTIITKDLSRLGREHIQAGMYLELFRRSGIRFIAITNGVDSINPESLEYVPFLNIFSEWFARDTSKKIKAVIHAKGNAGKPLSCNAIYGFMKSPEDKNIWLIDEYPASVVKRIFQMTIGGMGPYQIARQLTMEKIERPSYYFAKNRMTGPKPSSRDLSEPHTWSGGTIAAILAKPEYCGHTVNFRTRKESYKDKGYKQNPKEEWKVFPNTHPAIVEQETFDTVQKLRGTPRRIDTTGEANPLTGLVFCADCEAKMYNKRQSKDYCIEKCYGKEYRRKTSNFYTCSTYDFGKSTFKKVCSSHYIRTQVIRDLVLDRIRDVCQYVRDNEAEFIEKLRAESAVKQAEMAKSHQRQLAKNERRISELDHLFTKVYEDNAVGRLSDERFEQMSGAYESEQAELKKQNAVLQSELDAFHADTEKAGQFTELVRRYRDFEELTTEMLNEFVHRIYVFEADKSSGERRQKVAIYLNLIGDFDAPRVITEMTPAEKEAEEKRLLRLAKQREANRRYYAKIKAEYEKLSHN
jgi:DNA invertase Pin-like site-specific DNA recombinase